LELAAAALRRGGVVAVPTDTVYGLAADPSLPEAVAGLFALKQRPTDVPLPVLVASRHQVAEIAGPLEPAARHLADRFWPGPLTLVVPRLATFKADLGGPTAARRTVGVRLPDHPFMRALCQAVGPLAVTSANPHGAPPAVSAHQVTTAFPGADPLVLVVDGGICDGTPSSVVECRGPASRGLREGALPWAELFPEGAGQGWG
jgi:tRNA threonylcarbamoyl adenosine modification protein (Sua5/YciO/YrdC/YwlC family)